MDKGRMRGSVWRKRKRTEGRREGGRKAFKLNLTLHQHNKDSGQQGGERLGVLLLWSQVAKNASEA